MGEDGGGRTKWKTSKGGFTREPPSMIRHLQRIAIVGRSFQTGATPSISSSCVIMRLCESASRSVVLSRTRRVCWSQSLHPRSPHGVHRLYSDREAARQIPLPHGHQLRRRHVIAHAYAGCIHMLDPLRHLYIEDLSPQTIWCFPQDLASIQAVQHDGL